MNNQKMRITLLLLVILLIIAAALWFIPYATIVEISFHGYVITSDGQILETVDIEISGPKNDYLFHEDQYALRISASGTDWNFSTPADMVSARDPYIDVPYLSFPTHIISETQSDGGRFALSLEEGYFIAGRSHDNTQFLIGSTMADTDPATITDFFSEYITFYFLPG